jgi:hypothetical protein
VAKKTKKTDKDIKELRAKAKTPVERIAKLMKRPGPTLRQKGASTGIAAWPPEVNKPGGSPAWC